jgi:hypothetical protein
MHKNLAAVLVFCILLPVFGTAANAEPAPLTIYVRGSTTIYRFDENGNSSGIYDDGEYIAGFLAKAAPLLPAARLSGNYDAYAETETLVPLASVLPSEEEAPQKGLAGVLARIRAFFGRIAEWLRDLFKR